MRGKVVQRFLLLSSCAGLYPFPRWVELLVLAELGESAPAQEDHLLKEAIGGGYSAGREAVDKQTAEAQSHYSPEQLVQSQNRGAQPQGSVHIYCAVGTSL